MCYARGGGSCYSTLQICSFIMHLWHQTPPLELRMEACEGNDYDLLSTPAFNALEQTGTQ